MWEEEAILLYALKLRWFYRMKNLSQRVQHNQSPLFCPLCTLHTWWEKSSILWCLRSDTGTKQSYTRYGQTVEVTCIPMLNWATLIKPLAFPFFLHESVLSPQVLKASYVKWNCNCLLSISYHSDAGRSGGFLLRHRMAETCSTRDSCHMLTRNQASGRNLFCSLFSTLTWIK